MSILEDLHTSISQMSDEELAETFRQIRLQRRTFKRKKKKKTVAKSRAKKSTVPSPSSLSPEMAQELLKALGA